MADSDVRAEPVDEIKIANFLREHGPREGAALAAYEQLIAEVDDPGIRYLAQMILEDERRHHSMITAMLHQIESFLWNTEVDGAVPYLEDRVDPSLHAATKGLLDLEHEDANELRHLRRALKHQPSGSLLPLLVECMLHDTAKHIAILETIRDHTKAK